MKAKTNFLPLLILNVLILSACGAAEKQGPSSSADAKDSASERQEESLPSESKSIQESEDAFSSEAAGGDVSSDGEDGEQSESGEKGSESSEEPSPTPIVSGSLIWLGADDVTWPLNHYFDPFEDVKAVDDKGEDFSSFISVSGHVDYGKEGPYTLTYKVGESRISRTVTIKSGASLKTYASKNISFSESFAKGSVRSGEADVSKPRYSPSYMSSRFAGKPVPTNKWWSCLAVQNRGGMSGTIANSLYPGAYKSAFVQDGFEFTDNGKGFVEYMKAGAAGNENTAAVHANFFSDSIWRTPNLSSAYQTSVIDYSDASVKVACRNGGEGSEDEMVATMSQGAPFAYLEIKGNQLQGTFRTAGITRGYAYYDLDGNEIAANSAYSGKAIIVKLGGAHCGYTATTWGGIGSPTYKDSYFLLVAKSGSVFTPVHRAHPDATLNDGLDLALAGNTVAFATLGDTDTSFNDVLSQAKSLVPHAYTKVNAIFSSYQVNHETGKVTTAFNAQTEKMEGDEDPVLGLFPHQYKHSSLSLTPYYHHGFQGRIKFAYASSFATTLSFNGILPNLPLASNLDKSKMKEYLSFLDENNVPGVRNYDNDTNAYINKSAPYWNAKALYPLAQGLFIAEQLGESALSLSFKDKLRTVLADWYSYDATIPARDESANQAGDRYFYYNSEYGALTFSDDEFNTSGELSDHHFTHGYLVYAGAMLSLFDSDFASSYKDMLSFEVRDFASYDKEDSLFPYLRCFDPYMGHCWANGLSCFSDGNNEESEGEALSAWAGAYLYGQLSGDQKLIDASIYGYTSELVSAKTYWFDYDKDVWLQEAHDARIGCMAIQWGGKYDYATWFGANPSFIYGIEWLPIGHYLSGYASNESERSRLKEIYGLYESAQASSPAEKTWRANFASVKSLFDPEGAISDFDVEAMKKEDYPNEIALGYYFVNGNKGLGYRQDDMSVASPYLSFASYANGAYLYNPTSSSVKTSIKLGSITKEVTVPAKSFLKA